MDAVSILVVCAIFGGLIYTLREPLTTIYEWCYALYLKNKPMQQQEGVMYQPGHYMFGDDFQEGYE